MSLYVEFEPHSWYMGFAIRNNYGLYRSKMFHQRWTAYTDNGNTYQVDELNSLTLTNLKEKIREYRGKK